MGFRVLGCRALGFRVLGLRVKGLRLSPEPSAPNTPHLRTALIHPKSRLYEDLCKEITITSPNNLDFLRVCVYLKETRAWVLYFFKVFRNSGVLGSLGMTTVNPTIIYPPTLTIQALYHRTQP